jgi:membrane-associated phospholipid phosphatase
MIFEDTISMSVVVLYAVPILLYIFTQDPKQIIGLLGLIGATSLSEAIKLYIIKDASPRPKGANNCNLWCSDGNQDGKPGMPSSHSAEVSFFAGFYFQQTTNIYIRGMLVLYAMLVMLSRYTKKCHNIYQIVTGSLLGIILSILVVWYL